MKVCCIGNFFDGSGWAAHGINLALALDEVGIEVVCRPLKLSQEIHPVSPRLYELLGRDASGCDVVIQVVLPHLACYDGAFKNIIHFASEYSSIHSSGWVHRLNLLDEVWTINRQQAEACRRAGVTKPVHVQPHGYDVSVFDKKRSLLDCLLPYKERGEFLFYAVGELTVRKNLRTTLAAFHLEFAPSEPVRLVVKTSVPGLPPDRQAEKARLLAKEVKEGLKLHGERLDLYKKEVFLAGRLPEEDLFRLHETCDCFVQCSHGEAWDANAYYAMGFGKTPIVSAWGGYLDYLSDAEGWLVQGREEPCLGNVDTIPFLGTGQECWFEPSITHLRKCMRAAYNHSTVRQQKAACGRAKAKEFSFLKVGQRAANILSGTSDGQEKQKRRLASHPLVEHS